jgi:hypothetical protein
LLMAFAFLFLAFALGFSLLFFISHFCILSLVFVSHFLLLFFISHILLHEIYRWLSNYLIMPF